MLRLENISLALGGFRLRSINFHIRAGEYRVLLGPTGTGKTVLLETLAGLHTPQQGHIYLNNRDITKTPPEDRHMGVVYQDYALFPHLSVSDNIAFGLRIQGRERNTIRTAVRDMAGFLKIEHILTRTPRNLSGGECQRVALARALVLQPHVLLLDEPLSAVDRLTRDHLRGELKRIHQELAITILHITHDLTEAFFLADRMTVMQEGVILQEGTAEAISQKPATRFVAELLGRKNFIPARVDSNGLIQVKGMGMLDPGLLLSPPEKERKILISFPGSSVVFSSSASPETCWWQGRTRIIDMNSTSDRVDVKLALPDRTSIQTMFSRREMNSLPFSMEPGMEVDTGISRENLHWLPLDDD